MKKILIALLIFCSCLFAIGNNFCWVSAAQTTNNKYLINADYQQNAAAHGILPEEIKSTNTPFDYLTKSMSPGQSISPTESNQTSKEFSKTITTNNVTVSATESLYLYIYFSEEVANSLSITLTDNSTNSASWSISRQELNNQIVMGSSSSKVRYGWQLLEFPLIAADMVGNLQTINSLKMDYISTSVNQQNKYAKVTFYAPYINASQNSKITFSNKQNIYNFNMYLGEKLNNYCVGDEFVINTWKDIVEYCVVGDIDCKKYETNKYFFKLQLYLDGEEMLITRLGSGQCKIGLVDEGTYTFRLSLYDSDENWLWEVPDQQIYVRPFVAVYLPNGLPDMDAGKSASFNISFDSLIVASNNLSATSSDESVASVSIENGELVVSAKNAGKTTIKLSIMATRANQEEQVYQYEYTLTVTQTQNNSWVGLIFGAIGLIIAGVIVYIIMVKRRLISGKYPKY